MAARRYPVVSETEGRAAIMQIVDRRERVGDPDFERISDAPLELVTYVLTHRRVPPEVLKDDALLCLRILHCARPRVRALPGEIDGLEVRVLHMGKEHGLTYRQLAVPMGMSHQGVENLLLRHASGQRGNVRHESLERAARKADAREVDWRTRYGRRLLAGAARLLAATETASSEEVADWLEELRLTMAEIPDVERVDMASIGRVALRIRLVLNAVKEEQDDRFAAAVGSTMQEMILLAEDYDRTVAL
ncbi:hypothetical protein ACFV1N_48675 [Streptosporangium canum]|uniref:hypothetical protein n=1 Tax=Streptosporangium canum TaxID=324952 RepID=UPI0036A7FCB0